MSDFTPVCKVSDLSDPGKMLIDVQDRLVALFHVDGNFWAIDDVCTHDGGPLAEGELLGCEIQCPRHGARFDVRTGRPLCMPAIEPVAVHPIEVRGDDIYVAVE